MRMSDLKRQTELIQQKTAALGEERANHNSYKKQLKSFLDTLEAMPEQLTRFNGKDFLDTVDRVEVGQHILTYHFYGGEYIKVNIQLLKTICI